VMVATGVSNTARPSSAEIYFVEPGDADAGRISALALRDSGRSDSGLSDAGSADAGSADAGSQPRDAGAADAGSFAPRPDYAVACDQFPAVPLLPLALAMILRARQLRRRA